MKGQSIARLENVAEQKLAMVRQMDKDTADTIVWLRNRENQRRFKMEIFEPPAISLKVDDARFVNAIEACFNFTQMKVRLVPDFLGGMRADDGVQCVDIHHTVSRG